MYLLYLYRMKSIAAIIGLVFLGCLTASCIRDEISGGEDFVKPGDALPDFSVVLNDGRELSTQSLRGKVVVLIFFHTDCPDCREELPVIQRLYEEYASSKEVEFYAISREEGEEAVAVYWQEHAFTVPYSAQESRNVYDLFSTKGIPKVYVCGRDGKVVSAYSDSPVATFLELKEDIENTLNFSSYLFAE